MSSKLKEKRKATQNSFQEQGLYKYLDGRYKINMKPIGQGVSSNVYAGVSLQTNIPVAVKKIKDFFQNESRSFNLRILRQMILLRVLQHPNIIKLFQIIREEESSNEIYFVLEYFPYDIKKVLKSNLILNEKTILSIVFQILAALKYCHQCQVLHRDLKPQNILISQDLTQVKLCDFGLARAVTMEELLSQPSQPLEKKESTEPQKKAEKIKLTTHVTTRWYRAPQLIILQSNYSSAIDIWSVGCIFGELLGLLEKNSQSFLSRKALFPGKACYPLSPPKDQVKYKKVNDFPHSVNDQLSVIFEILGTPEDISFITNKTAREYIQSFAKKDKKSFRQIYNYIPEGGQSFLEECLQFNPNKRITIQDAIKHPLFDPVRQNFKANIAIEAEVVSMELQDLSKEEIQEIALGQIQHYKNLKQEKMKKKQKIQTKITQ